VTQTSRDSTVRSGWRRLSLAVLGSAASRWWRRGPGPAGALHRYRQADLTPAPPRFRPSTRSGFSSTMQLSFRSHRASPRETTSASPGGAARPGSSSTACSTTSRSGTRPRRSSGSARRLRSERARPTTTTTSTTATRAPRHPRPTGANVFLLRQLWRRGVRRGALELRRSVQLSRPPRVRSPLSPGTLSPQSDSAVYAAGRSAFASTRWERRLALGTLPATATRFCNYWAPATSTGPPIRISERLDHVLRRHHGSPRPPTTALTGWPSPS
jgi:hypothetical protein